jgi:hypothetical protein
MILTLLWVALGFVAGVTLAMFLDRQESREKDRLISSIVAIERRNYARFQRINDALETDLIGTRAELAAARFDARRTEGGANEAKLNPESFLSGLNEDMRKALQRMELEAKIEAWQNSDCAGPLPEFLGMSADEQAAFVEKDHNEGLWENVGADQRNQSRKPA